VCLAQLFQLSILIEHCFILCAFKYVLSRWCSGVLYLVRNFINAICTTQQSKIWCFLDVAPCNLVEVYRRFGDTCWLHRPRGGTKDHWNAGQVLPVTAVTTWHST
jgi:hypothetical protein